jgi:hypothetical protein
MAGPSDPCPTWDREIGNPGAVGGSVQVVRVRDNFLLAGGSFSQFEGVNLFGWARVDLNTGVNLGFGGAVPTDGFVTDFELFDSGDGEKLYITGAFNSVSDGVGTIPNSKGMVRWDGVEITTVPGSPFTGIFDFMYAMEHFNGGLAIGGGGGDANGQKPTLAFWDGTTWTRYSNEFAGAVAPVILALQEFQGDLYFAGRFETYDADLNDPNNPLVASRNIMKFDGTNFSGLDGGVFRATSIVSQVLCMEVFDDGSGEKLYVGGRFDRLGSNTGAVSPAVARWDGAAWETMSGFPQAGREVRDFEVVDGVLFAVGNFDNTGDGSVVCRKFAKWNGSTWEEVGDGFDISVLNANNPNTMAGVDDGFYIGGSFITAGNGTGPNAGTANGVVKWVSVCSVDCPGDTNGDNIVNFADLNTVLAQFGQTGQGLAGDVNGDEAVNFTDLNLVLTNFGAICN